MPTRELVDDLDGAELYRLGVRSTPLARRALTDVRRARLDAWVATLPADALTAA